MENKPIGKRTPRKKIPASEIEKLKKRVEEEISDRDSRNRRLVEITKADRRL